MRVFKFLTVESNCRRFTRFKWQMLVCFRSDASILGSMLCTIEKRIPKSACSSISTMKVLKLPKTLKLLKVSKLLKVLKLLKVSKLLKILKPPKTLSFLRRLKKKGREREKQLLNIRILQPLDRRLRWNTWSYLIVKLQQILNLKIPRGMRLVDIDKVIEHKTLAEYVIISDSETATDSEPEVPKGNETRVETDKEIVQPMDLDYDTSRTISAGPTGLVELSYCPNEDSDDESDDISSNSLRKRKAGLNKKKRKALKTKKPRFDNAEKTNRELDVSHAELLVHFVKALNLDEEMSVAKRKGSGSSSRSGCCKPSGSGSAMDLTGGAKKQQALKAKVPQLLVMTKSLSHIVEVLKLEFAKKKLPEASLLSEGDSVPAQNKGSGSSARSVAGRAHGAEIRKALKAKAPQLDVAGPSSRGPKDDHIPTQKLVKVRRLSDMIKAGKCIGSGVCGGVDECEPSGSKRGANGFFFLIGKQFHKK